MAINLGPWAASHKHIQTYRYTEIQKRKNADPQNYINTEAHKYRSKEMHMYRNTQIHNFKKPFLWVGGSAPHINIYIYII